MDVWLLATQLMLGGVDPAAKTSPDLRQPGLTAGLGRCPSRDAVQADCATEGGSMEAIAQTGTPRNIPSNTQAAGGPVPAPSIPPRSMSAAAAHWPRPDQVMAPIRNSPGSEWQRPVTGAQLYQFRWAALRAGDLYPQARPQGYLSQWQRAFDAPTHPQWQDLLVAEAAAMARRQGQTPLTVVVGDSLALWLPPEDLPQGQLWLNQSISGETTAHMLGRLHYFAATRPSTIHILAGINDLKTGLPEAVVADNLYQMLAQLRRQHPQARLVVHSILPTRLREISGDRIQRVNDRLTTVAAAHGAVFADLHPAFSDDQGQLRADLTTDGLHLSPQGYGLWRAALARY